MNGSSLNSALRSFEIAEANLQKLEKIWEEIEKAIPQGITFFDANPDYENNCRSFGAILKILPKIDGWKPEIELPSLNEIAQGRFDAKDIGMIEAMTMVEDQIQEPGRLLREYRFRFDQKRRALIRETMAGLINNIDNALDTLSVELEINIHRGEAVAHPKFEELKEFIAQIDMLLGSSIPRPSRWRDMHRHMRFGEFGDLEDIIRHDWPNIRSGLRESLYGEKEPIPIDIEDLSTLVESKPYGPVATKLAWERLNDDDFERLIFVLISSVKGYENPKWVMKTNAPDKGRDLSVERVYNDELIGTIRHRVIIQCKHWLSRSVGQSEISLLRDQMQHWGPPKVDVHVIATSGRFTADAVQFIEKYNHSNNAMRIEMWPDSHLERLLASRPAIIGEFGLR
ncbi:MAG: restriction endonuclease [Lewinellaceae bacterium]|nr:restriction endonuclease [Lewinellaceae bacterium]